mgnify:CR=1 FL=1
MLKALAKKKDFRKKLLITFCILVVIQIASGIPTPGVNTSYFRLLLASNGTLGMFNALSGNGLQSLSITMLSITPYITSSIILQLMCSIIPSLGEVQKDGETGRKKFKMYKFRSMYMDAEERKKELMKDNRVEDGMMFKLEFDPRVIGNKVLPNGEKKTGIGNLIRKTSLDEFPQFLNVLKGDMSLVGTRPPTLDEWEKYELHHRARLAIKPGITGMWQVSGRSDITDFEEVVKLDMKYIANWNFGLDIKILIKTVASVLRHEGSM